MPDAPLRPCTYPGGCAELTTGGPCAAHRQQKERWRGTASSRGYDSHWTNTFRPWFISKLIALGIAPICGAALPDGPSMVDSECRTKGVANANHLHLDHDPPLREHERSDRRKVEDPTRVGLLCRRCHARKTQREQQAGLA